MDNEQDVPTEFTWLYISNISDAQEQIAKLNIQPPFKVYGTYNPLGRNWILSITKEDK